MNTTLTRPRRLLIAVALAGAVSGLLVAPIATAAAVALAGAVFAGGGRRLAPVIAGVLIGLAIAGVRVDRSDRHPPPVAAGRPVHQHHHARRSR
jgi:Na+/serine symporter